MRSVLFLFCLLGFILSSSVSAASDLKPAAQTLSQAEAKKIVDTMMALNLWTPSRFTSLILEDVKNYIVKSDIAHTKEIIAYKIGFMASIFMEVGRIYGLVHGLYASPSAKTYFLALSDFASEHSSANLEGVDNARILNVYTQLTKIEELERAFSMADPLLYKKWIGSDASTRAQKSLESWVEKAKKSKTDNSKARVVIDTMVTEYLDGIEGYFFGILAPALQAYLTNEEEALAAAELAVVIGYTVGTILNINYMMGLADGFYRVYQSHEEFISFVHSIERFGDDYFPLTEAAYNRELVLKMHTDIIKIKELRLAFASSDEKFYNRITDTGRSQDNITKWVREGLGSSGSSCKHKVGALASRK